MKEKLKKWLYIFLPIILGSLVGFILSDYIDYTDLIQPPGSPPSWLFPVAWSIIYFLMGLSYYILRKDTNDLSIESIIYYMQLIINLLWSFIFFYFKLRFISCIWIILLDVLVAVMLYWFYKRNKISAYLNIFYMLWILFATYLTIGIYLLN